VQGWFSLSGAICCPKACATWIKGPLLATTTANTKGVGGLTRLLVLSRAEDIPPEHIPAVNHELGPLYNVARFSIGGQALLLYNRHTPMELGTLLAVAVFLACGLVLSSHAFPRMLWFLVCGLSSLAFPRMRWGLACGSSSLSFPRKLAGEMSLRLLFRNCVCAAPVV
jgi:hypothetical protein